MFVFHSPNTTHPNTIHLDAAMGRAFGFGSSEFAKQKYPERLEIVDVLPYTAAGEIWKNLLRE
jgi:acyl-CoA synthetase (AMP-forming)/AMP-acid ligase II